MERAGVFCEQKVGQGKEGGQLQQTGFASQVKGLAGQLALYFLDEGQIFLCAAEYDLDIFRNGFQGFGKKSWWPIFIWPGSADVDHEYAMSQTDMVCCIESVGEVCSIGRQRQRKTGV